MANKAPAFQFYPRDWLSSPSVQTMGLAACGAYINLLCVAWESKPVATLPNNDEDLRNLARASEQEWNQIKEKILPNFVPTSNNRLLNKRLRKQWRELKAFKKKQVQNGKKGGAPKGNGNAKTTQKQPKTSSASASASASASVDQSQSQIPPQKRRGDHSPEQVMQIESNARARQERERKEEEFRRETRVGMGPSDVMQQIRILAEAKTL